MVGKQVSVGSESSVLTATGDSEVWNRKSCFRFYPQRVLLTITYITTAFLLKIQQRFAIQETRCSFSNRLQSNVGKISALTSSRVCRKCMVAMPSQICTVVDRLLKERHHIATDNELDTERLDELFMNPVRKHSGLPGSIVSQFISDLNFWRFYAND